MAQTGFTPIQLYRTTTAAATPTAGNLADGELAINTTDERLFFKNAAGTVKVIAGAGGAGIVAGSNTQVQFNNNGVFGASANLTFDGTNLTLGGGTANGVAYLNGSKVLTTGSALTFDGTTFTATTNAALAKTSGSAWVSVGDNSAGNGSLRLFGASSQKGWQIGSNITVADALEFSLATANGGTTFTDQKMILTSTGLGIGTSSPAVKLQVYNNINGTPFAWGNAARTGYLYQDASGVGITNASGTGFDEGMYLDTANSNVLLYTNSTVRATLDSSGNLGLGVTPSAWSSQAKALEIGIYAGFYRNASGLTEVAFNSYQNTSNNDTYRVSANPAGKYQIGGGHAWFVAPSGTAGDAISFTQAMTLDASGNLLLGTTSSSYVTSNRASFVVNGTTQSILGLATGGTNKGYLYSDGTNILLYSESASGFMGFGTNNTERARIDSSGDLLVGATSLTVDANYFAYSAGNAYANFGHSTGVASGAPYARFLFAGSVIGSITQSGTTAVLYDTGSDYRLKNITGPITTSGAYIDSLNPVEGTWKADGSTFVGLIAHEVQEASRTPVATGTKDGEQMQGMDYSSAEIIANMLAELKSLRARVAALESN